MTTSDTPRAGGRRFPRFGRTSSTGRRERPERYAYRVVIRGRRATDSRRHRRHDGTPRQRASTQVDPPLSARADPPGRPTARPVQRLVITDVTVLRPTPGPAPTGPKRKRLPRTRRVVRRCLVWCSRVGLAGLVLAIFSLIFAYQPDQFQRVVANYRTGIVAADDAASVRDFTDELFSIQGRWWTTKRVRGTRIQMDQLVIDAGDGSGSVRMPDPDNPDPGKRRADGTIRFPVRCPDGGEFVKIFVKRPNTSQLGTLDSRNKIYALDGMYIVGSLKYRFDGPTQKRYCYLDLFPDE